jgi:pimeloyl-ACP methyl ester carboxylesterase
VVQRGESDTEQHVILCGHSYAGMVVSGVADLISERIAALVLKAGVLPSVLENLGVLTSPSGFIARTLF